MLGLGAMDGCGGEGSSAQELRLRREDLIVVARALQLAAGQAEAEVAAAKLAWPLVANGLPGVIEPPTRRTIAAAQASAARIGLPAPLREAQANTLTGPAAEIAGLFRSFALLSGRAWRLIAASADTIQHGSAASARFARQNAALYLEGVYDAHFTLAQIGKKLLSGYRRLGGPEAFGAALPAGTVRDLARAYSEASDRLHPHVGVRLGS